MEDTLLKKYMDCSRIIICILILQIAYINCEEDSDQVVFKAGINHSYRFGEAKSVRYLLYEVNPGEGFNLRRDVYMRLANLVKLLNEEEPWILVLPPWGRLYHWKSPIEQNRTPWSHFFDLDSLRLHIPVIEFEDFLKVQEEPTIGEIYYLQRYKEGWRDGKWEERLDRRDCIDTTGFVKDGEKWLWHFWGYDNVYGKQFECLSVQAEYPTMKSFLLHNTTAKSVFLMRGEQLTHGRYSNWSPKWWTARRSMVFAKYLREVGDFFREKYLESTDEKDRTLLDTDWTQMKKNQGDAIGGPYLAAHLRRRDFLYGHKKDIPSLEGTANQIKKALQGQKLTRVFISTDAPQDEYETIKKHLVQDGFKVFRYEPSQDELERYQDGGVAIIDQWICAHAKYFIGTSVSTFTFRIHEEREILGFKQESTYNQFCGDSQGENCEQPSKWKIVYE